ncbi:MAG: family 16 glycosylhydrolase [Paludibacteraceae bacterium]|nr:family 16 glycosylhydrolase [Paludibacteraceae bacterium]
MNLFTARLTGKMLSTDAFEKTMYEMQERVKRWRQIEKSPELAEYKQLKELVESQDFQEKKTALQTRKYKDTDEGRKMTMFKRLRNARSMRRYQDALKNEEFQAFLDFRNTDEFYKVNSVKECLKSGVMRRYNMIYHSSYFKNYLKVQNSVELRQLGALEEEIKTEDFQKRHALWADPKRWQHSEEYKKYARFEELANSDDIKFYFEQRQEKIDWAELFRPAFEDHMESGKNWKSGFGYANPAMKDGHSRTADWQAYAGGKNTFFVDGRMDIETREESKKAIAWDEKRGFVEHVFDYTSDVMNCKEAFSQEGGMFMAKVRSQGSGHHFFGLSTGKTDKPLVALYHYNGNIHQVGYVDGKQSHMADLTGMLRTMYYVYTFRWTKSELIWYVNNLEILRLPNRLPKEAMFFFAQSWLPKSEKAGQGKMKVQWARVFRAVD